MFDARRFENIMRQKIVVVDHNGGNLASASTSVTFAAQKAGLAIDVIISGAPADIMAADRLILPGQGAFNHCAKAVQGPLLTALHAATEAGTPYLGICVGMQLMAARGLEHGETTGFGWIRGTVDIMTEAREAGLRLPHMGWNNLEFEPDAHPLLRNIAPGEHGYFVHSYALQDYDPADVIASTTYGGKVPAIVARGNRCGTQFHVEKSQHVGIQFLINFLTWSPSNMAVI
ncbi:Imidazole glycerol phosphate synthase subunit HisH [Acetobacteraceae bacterium EV16G]|uniref:Imidazole glycerol phosphate synthase subunit HisH n=2 Tax=Sorlinia euscelidii TaxID=3081148 RepID=A0ABU7U5Y7_9PROT